VKAVQRFDFGELREPKRTPQGGIRVPAYPTRAGIFEYRREDGVTVRELRPPEEVFHEDSLKTLVDAAVTELHPSELVTASSWSKLARGHVGESVKQDGDFVAAELVVQDADTVAKVERKDLRELSCGYTCVVDETPGEWKGERYDQVQRRIRYNHVALGPVGWGRAGRQVALRMDAGDAVQVTKTDAAGEAVAPPVRGRSKPTMKIKIPSLVLSERGDSATIDGVPYSLKGQGAKQASAALDASLKRFRDQRTDALDEQAAKDAFAALAETAASMQSQLLQLGVAITNAEPAAPAEPTSPSEEVLDAMLAKRDALRQHARKVAPAVKLDGLKDREIMEAAIKAQRPSIKLDGVSEDYVRGLFDALPAASSARSEAPRHDSLDAVGRALTNPPREAERNDADDAVKKAAQERADAWKQPLSAHRKGITV
jgi:uncharacterized protein